MTDREVHPVAALFPMLAEDELRDMAADIAERGLLQPIMLDAQGRILDGRNRYAACKIAGVEPRFETYDGDDPDGYALASGTMRRNLTQGQQAIVVAKAIQIVSASQREAARTYGVPQPRLAEAVQIIQYCKEGADLVLRGTIPFSAALETARGVQKYQLEREALPADLAALVESGVRDLSDALIEAAARDVVYGIDKIRDRDGAPPPTFTERAAGGSLTWDEAATLAQQWQAERGEALARGRTRIERITQSWGVIETILADPDGAYVAEMLDGLGQPDREALQRIISQVRRGQ